MPILSVTAPDGKLLSIDAKDADPSQYDAIVDDVIKDYMASKPGVKSPILDTGMRAMTGSMNPTPPNILPQEANIPYTSGKQAGNAVGEAIAEEGGREGHPILGAAAGTAFTAIPETYKAFMSPDVVAGGEVLNSALAPLGEGIASILQGWGKQAALYAAGIINKVAESFGSKNLPAIAQFLMTPIKIGSQELPPILTATSSPASMKAAAEAVRDAAGKVLESVDPVIDKVLSGSPNLIDLNGIIADLNELQATTIKYHPRAGNAVIKELQKHIDDFKDLILTPTTSENLFSALRAFKTTLGELIQNFESDAPVKKAAQKVYGVVAGGLETAAASADQASGSLFAEANDIYTKILPIIDALEGKAVKSGFFSDFGSMGVGALYGLAHPAAAIPAAVATHITKKYGPQAVAAGLNAASNIIPPLATGVAQGLPVAARAINSALGQ